MQKIAGVFATILACLFLLLYQNFVALKGVDAPLEQTTAEEVTLEGFEEPEEAVEYLLYQIQQGNLDAALRVCAISDVAEYFYMADYLKDTENFMWMDMIPPPDMENAAYIEIARLRMTYDYAVMFENLYQELSLGRQMKILAVQKDEPENPDGLYFQRRTKISNILGSRDVSEMIAYVEVDGTVKELHFSVARYRRFWKILMCSDFDGRIQGEPLVRDADLKAKTLGENFEEHITKDMILPKNYYVLPEKKADTPEELVSNLILYLQRGDSLSAMSYFTIDQAEERTNVDISLLARQNEIAKCIQWFYYRMFLYDENKLAWAGRHFNDEPEYIPELLDTTNMIFTDFAIHEWAELEPGKMGCRFGYLYGSQYFSNYVVLVNRDGWMLESMGD